VGAYRHAVARDLVALGYRGREAPIDLGEFISVVLAAPPTSAVRFAAQGGWSQTDELLANLSEQYAGVHNIDRRYIRPGVTPPPVEADPGPLTADGGVRLTPQTREQFDARRRRDAARGEELAATERKQVQSVPKRVRR
jgi:hypothetical protein